MCESLISVKSFAFVCVQKSVNKEYYSMKPLSSWVLFVVLRILEPKHLETLFIKSQLMVVTCHLSIIFY